MRLNIWSSLLYFELYVYASEHFFCILEKVPQHETFLSLFATEHHSKLSLVLSPHFNSSMSCQLLISPVSPQDLLAIFHEHIYELINNALSRNQPFKLKFMFEKAVLRRSSIYTSIFRIYDFFFYLVIFFKHICL